MQNSPRDNQIEQALAALNAGQFNETLNICQKILESNMSDAEAWSIYGLAGIQFEADKGIQALQRAVQLEPNEPRWRIHLGVGYDKLNKSVEAEQVLLGAVELTDHADEAVIPWANSLLKLGRLDDAKTGLIDAAEKKKSPALWMHLSNVLSANDDLIGSVAAREKAYDGLEIPRNEKLNIANQHVLLGQYDQSQKYVDELLSHDKNAPDTILLAANLMRWRGELDDAHDALSKAVENNTEDPRLLLGLLDLNRDEDDRLLASAKTFVADNRLSAAVRRGLSFVVARRADRKNQYDEAWQYALKANALYDDGAASPTAEYKQQLETGLKLFKNADDLERSTDSRQIYLIGPPRSGGSLLQTILAAAPGCVSVGERGALMAWILPLLAQSGSPEQTLSEWTRIVPDLRKADIAGMLRSHGQNNDTTFIDKMPHHSHVAGLVNKVHPGSRFVDVRRDPLDMAMSILFHDFTDKFGYSRSIADIGDYLGFQRTAVQAWQEAGLDVLVHDHNTFLDDPEQSASSLFSQLDLPWEASFLEPENRTSTVRTFSALQVRSKVTKAYSGRGENYREFMGDTADQLDALKS